MHVSRTSVAVALLLACGGGSGDGSGDSTTGLEPASPSAGSTWTTLAEGSPTAVAGPMFAPRLFVSSGGLHVSTGPRNPLMRLGGSAWEVAASGEPGARGETLTFASDGARLWAGSLDHAIPSCSVLRWSGAEWSPVGSRLYFDPATTMARAPYLAFDGENPVAAWDEWSMSPEGALLRRVVRVAAWTGDDWTVVSTPSQDGYVTSIASSSSGAYVAYLAGDGVGIRVGRVRSGAWELLPELPRIVEAASVLVAPDGSLLLSGSMRDTRGAYFALMVVLRWNGVKWSWLGTALNGGARVVGLGSLAVPSSGNPIAVWEEAPEDGDPRTIYAAEWDGTAWQRPWGVLDVDESRDAVYPALTLDAAGTPVVAWSEQTEGTFGSQADPPQYKVFLKKLSR